MESQQVMLTQLAELHPIRPYGAPSPQGEGFLKGVLQMAEKESVVITCDPDNTASRKTCEGLGCELERIITEYLSSVTLADILPKE